MDINLHNDRHLLFCLFENRLGAATKMVVFGCFHGVVDRELIAIPTAMGGLWYRNENGKQRIGTRKHWLVALRIGVVGSVFLHKTKIHCVVLNPLKSCLLYHSDDADQLTVVRPRSPVVVSQKTNKSEYHMLIHKI